MKDHIVGRLTSVSCPPFFRGSKEPMLRRTSRLCTFWQRGRSQGEQLGFLWRVGGGAAISDSTLPKSLTWSTDEDHHCVRPSQHCHRTVLQKARGQGEQLREKFWADTGAAEQKGCVNTKGRDDGEGRDFFGKPCFKTGKERKCHISGYQLGMGPKDEIIFENIQGETTFTYQR